jgi:hypothetical protein
MESGTLCGRTYHDNPGPLARALANFRSWGGLMERFLTAFHLKMGGFGGPWSVWVVVSPQARGLIERWEVFAFDFLFFVVGIGMTMPHWIL